MEPTIREIDVSGRKVVLLEAGSGAPLVYLHGFADVHGVANDLLPFHLELAQGHQLIAPAHPGCNGSDDFLQGNRIEDFLFHYCEVFDALGSIALHSSDIALGDGLQRNMRCGIPSA